MPLMPLLCAPFIGSFVGVLIRRLPVGRPVAWARSACDECNVPLAARDLIPLASFLALHGRCRACRAPIARFHPAVEMASLLVAAVVLSVVTDPVLAWADCALGWTLLALAWIDIEHLRLPDALTLPLLLAGLAIALATGADVATDHALAAGLACALLAGVALLYRRARGREGLGLGDAKLFAAGGAWVGLDGLAAVLLLAALLGLLAAASIGLRRGWVASAGTPLPFGPWLAIAIFAVRLALDSGGWMRIVMR